MFKSIRCLRGERKSTTTRAPCIGERVSTLSHLVATSLYSMRCDETAMKEREANAQTKRSGKSGREPCVASFVTVLENVFNRNQTSSSSEMGNFTTFLVLCVTLVFAVKGSLAIKCYQCSSDQDAKGSDDCGAYKKFNKELNIPIECNSEESHMPGSFCMKYTQQSPKGFIWDGRWRQVIRQCASVSSTGVTGVCNWGVYDNGDYWEQCYCSEDACNSAPRIDRSILAVGAVLLAVFYILN